MNAWKNTLIGSVLLWGITLAVLGCSASEDSASMAISPDAGHGGSSADAGARGGQGGQGGALGGSGGASAAGSAGQGADAGSQDAGVLIEAAPPSVSSACHERCTTWKQANCPKSVDIDACDKTCVSALVVDSCEQDALTLLSCQSELSHISCDKDGMPAVSGCEKQSAAFLKCAVCAPADQDDACDTCLKGSCCAERQDVVTKSGFSQWYECSVACGNDEKCFDECGKKFPNVDASFITLKKCSDLHCLSQCQ